MGYETVTNVPQLRVTHAPVNIAGIPWENVQALRRKGVDARLVVFERGKLHHEADWSLDRHGPLPQRLLQQFAAFARLAPATDVFHFYFGLTLVPKSIQFPLLRALRGDAPFTWRVALAWVGWVITATLAIGAVVDLRNAETGHKVSHDSPYAGQELKLVAKRQKRIARR